MSQPTVSSFFQARKKNVNQSSKKLIQTDDVTQIRSLTPLECQKPKEEDTKTLITPLITPVPLPEPQTPERKNKDAPVERVSKRDAFTELLEASASTSKTKLLLREKQRASSCSRVGQKEADTSARKRLDLPGIKKTSKNVVFLKQGNLSPVKVRPQDPRQSPFKLEKRSVLSPKRLQAIDALVSSSKIATSCPNIARSPLKTPDKKASPADVRKHLGSTNSLTTLQARLKSLSQTEEPRPNARKALFVEDDGKPFALPKASPALSRKGIDIDVKVSKPVISASPVKASPRKRALEEAERVVDKIKDLPQSSNLLPMPEPYKKLEETFRKIDELVAIKFNRSQAIALTSLKADVQIALRRSLTDKQLKQIRCVLPKAFTFTWEPKRDSRGRAMHDTELYISPNLEDSSAKMTPKDIVQRQKLFNHSLLTIVQDHHQEFLKSRGIEGIGNADIHRWDKEFMVDEYCPPIDELAFPEKPYVESPERNPQAMLEKIAGLNQSVEKALQRVAEVTTPKKLEAMTPITKAVDDDVKLDPALRDLPPHIVAKIKAQERERRIREMTMDKTKQKELEMLEELLYKRVSCPFTFVGFRMMTFSIFF